MGAKNNLEYDESRHKFGLGWTYRFCKRWDLTSQRKTKQNKMSMWRKYHKVVNYLYWVIYLVPLQRPHGAVRNDLKFGDEEMLQDRLSREKPYVPKSAQVEEEEVE